MRFKNRIFVQFVGLVEMIGITLLCIFAIFIFNIVLLFVEEKSQPLAVVLSPLPFVYIAYKLMKNQSKRVWLVLTVILPICCVYCYYHGSVVGEVAFRAHDTPINYPAHWGYNYQFYRIVVYSCDVIGYTAFWMIIAALVYRFYLGVAKLY